MLTRLPAEFTSLYRIFLRGARVSVLNHGSRTRALRKLFRPTFEAAVGNMKRLDHLGPEQATERLELEAWLNTFNERVDKTLSLFHVSAISRGLPHKITKQLSYLSLTHTSGWAQRRHFPPRRWNPQLPPDSPEYKPPKFPTIRVQNRERKAAQQHDIDDRGWSALSEVIRMAEGRDGLLLGRIRVTRRRWRK
ncbi:hypothetical protein BD410DRAFT_721915 [Rickenella mellea]|uniref:Uncharacterized protein n=1 Tax=Rickenella mellea TaxID=50990 RepID=A0A4Y7Q7V6_9AGAM|nr:hypothetical protein BD410DRAFT_721915 [Rickenella mellea]